MANMSYCMWENTKGELDQLTSDLSEALEAPYPSLKCFLDSKNEYERDAVYGVVARCRDLLKMYEELENSDA